MQLTLIKGAIMKKAKNSTEVMVKAVKAVKAVKVEKIKAVKAVKVKEVISTNKQATQKNNYSRSKAVEKGHKIYLASSMRMLDDKTGYSNINQAVSAGIKALNAGKAKTVYGVLQSKHHTDLLNYSQLVCVFNLRGNKVDNAGNLHK